MSRLACLLAAGAMIALPATSVRASDHADPIDNPLMFWKTTPLEGGITDLFVFPAKNGTQLVVILCVRRSLTGSPARLDQFEYAVHMDLKSAVDHTNEQNNARYGGTVANPQNIQATKTITYRLKNDAEVRVPPTITGVDTKNGIVVWGGSVTKPQKLDSITTGVDDAGMIQRNKYGPDTTFDDTKVNIWTGISEDPFIFPNFFGTNVVAMVATIPMTEFPDQKTWIVWATSSMGGKQIDHVGRSLRTQNPRFELLNTLHPKDHVAAIRDAHENPTIMRDIFLRLGINGLFGYRSWDFVPDVMLFTTQKGVVFGEYEAKGKDGKLAVFVNESDGSANFPNGRFLSDDVADRLARYGDTLLKELSHVIPPCQNPEPPASARDECKGSAWPRHTANDQLFQGQPNADTLVFEPKFPYLAEPFRQGAGLRVTSAPLTLQMSTVMAISLVLLAIALLWLGTAWLLALLIDRKRQRRRYL